MLIKEIYLSIQGESSFAGKPCIFVRLTGCNLRCSYCDTTHAFSGGVELSVNSVVDEIRRFNCKIVEITGGEPLLQRDVYELMNLLLRLEYTVLLETGGSIECRDVNPGVIKIIDFKCPGSGEEVNNCWENVKWLNPHDEVKFVVRDRKDYDWAKIIMEKYRLMDKVLVNISPVHGELNPKVLASWILKDSLNVRLNLQIHKYIWGPDKTSV